MSATTPTVEILLRGLRYAFRVPLLALHLCIGLPLIIFFISIGRGSRLAHAVIRAWMGGLAWVFGLRVRGEGTPLSGGTLFVANHVSWLDIVVLHSQHMMGFIAKSEIRGWPLIGWLATQGESIQVHVADHGHAQPILHEPAAKLDQRTVGTEAGGFEIQFVIQEIILQVGVKGQPSQLHLQHVGDLRFARRVDRGCRLIGQPGTL